MCVSIINIVFIFSILLKINVLLQVFTWWRWSTNQRKSWSRPSLLFCLKVLAALLLLVRSSHDDCNEDHDDYDDCNGEDCEHEDLNLCHQVIDAVQLGLHLRPSSPEIPRLGLIIGLLMHYNTHIQ